MDIKRAYRFRFYPTPAQEQNLARTFDCVTPIFILKTAGRDLKITRDASLNRVALIFPPVLEVFHAAILAE
ncbi:helix-turn-helix domain-containing protein [Thiorhodospira sibirica]|uniref:helix-turn-helix domain-containing protein n=1 Tax=Thiorhodospira sibirica TaxID=154347 RepID=UPI001C8F0003|nr:helix-turn-helix domain-containing protein [Thiorhodospira sibirica]